MTKSLPPRAVLFGRQAAEAREKLAEGLFDAAAVGEAMTAAALKGATLFVITPPEPFDLRATAAAVALMDTLKNQGFKLSWDPHNNPLGPDEAPFFSLVIRWELARETA